MSMVLALVEHDRAVIGDDTRQALMFARTLFPDISVAAVVIGGDELPAVAGADAVWHVRHTELFDYAPEAWSDALHQLAVNVGPAAVVASGTERGNEVLAHVAAVADQPFAANVLRATPGDPWLIRRMRWGGSLLEDATLTASLPILTSALHQFEPPTAGEPAPVTEFVPELGPDAARTRIVDRVQVAEGITLTTAPSS